MTQEPRPLPDAVVAALAHLLDAGRPALAANLDALCGRWPELAAAIRSEAEAMLRSLPAETTVAAAQPRKFERIGPFQILSEIGGGGMGTVYLAEQREPVRRRVALKVIKLGMDTKTVLSRFEAERQAMAMMDHSHIARIFEAGMTPAGRPYFAMEYVKGMPITRYCDEYQLSIEERLRLFRQVCSGVQHAHTKGVIHRDLSANNVLVTAEEAAPQVKIIDFGLARATDLRLTEKTLITEQGMVVGTPEYMSPEQASASGLDIDIRTDVYSLGVILYVLLSGSLPFSRARSSPGVLHGLLEAICTQEPDKPSTRIAKLGAEIQAVAARRRAEPDGLLRRLRRDLDWIVLKCLEKDRSRRYETVNELSADVLRHLQYEPVLARPPSLGYRLAKFARRSRGPLAAAGAVFLAVVAGLIGTTWFALEARAQAEAAETARRGEEANARIAAEQAAAARRSEALAMQSAAEVTARKLQFDQLAGVVRLQRVVADEAGLYPPWPTRIAAMRRWLEVDAAGLLAMRPAIEATLGSLRAALAGDPAPVRAVEATSLPAEAQPNHMAEESQRFLLDTLTDLLAKLDGLETNERPAVVRRLAWAERIADLSGAHPKARATWDQARKAIVRADGVVASASYAAQKIALVPQVGLVPIGMNPVTKLWEFYELRSAWDGTTDPADLAIPSHISAGERMGDIDVRPESGIVFVLLPGGRFRMGAQSTDPDGPNWDPQAEDDEALHEVELAPFFLARHELTQAQWRRLTNQTPSLNRAGMTAGSALRITWTNPVEQVGWFAADLWLRRFGMVLPTEAQWEYGCRAGTTTPWCCDRAALPRYANLADAAAKLACPTWHCEEWTDGHVVHAPVGTFAANRFGLHDVLGNLAEWTGDGDFGAAAAPRSGDGLRGDPAKSGARIYRGGAFFLEASSARCSSRKSAGPSLADNYLGIRPARPLMTAGE